MTLSPGERAKALYDECRGTFDYPDNLIAAIAAAIMEAQGWRPIETAPKDGKHIIVLTADQGAIEAFWDQSVTNFYKSQEGWASYDPENAQGDWVSWWNAPGDCRLFCGQTPKAWFPLPPPPIKET